jgi:hypothetical protein
MDGDIFGLDLLMNRSKKKKEEVKNCDEEDKWYNNELEEFKKMLSNRLRAFDPYENITDPIDRALYNAWLSHQWGYMSKTELYEMRKKK